MKTNIITAEIDLFNIFDLMGLHNLSAEEKQDYLDRIQVLLLKEFLLTALPIPKNPKDILDLNEKIKEEDLFSNYIKAIRASTPELVESLIRFIRKGKAEIIEKYYTNLLKEFELRIENCSDSKKLTDIKKRQTHYLNAYALMKENKWSELFDYHKQFSSAPFPAKTLPLPSLKNENTEKIIRLSKEKFGRKV